MVSRAGLTVYVIISCQMILYYIISNYITVKPVLSDHPREDQLWSIKTGVLLMEGHLNYTVRSGEMKMWSLNRGGLSGRFAVYVIILYQMTLYYIIIQI